MKPRPAEPVESADGVSRMGANHFTYRSGGAKGNGAQDALLVAGGGDSFDSRPRRCPESVAAPTHLRTRRVPMWASSRLLNAASCGNWTGDGSPLSSPLSSRARLTTSAIASLSVVHLSQAGH